jgi:hypothetical protein
VQLVDVLAMLGHVGVALLGGVCVTGVAGASSLLSLRCRSARQRATERVRGSRRWCWRGKEERERQGSGVVDGFSSSPSR